MRIQVQTDAYSIPYIIQKRFLCKWASTVCMIVAMISFLEKERFPKCEDTNRIKDSFS